MIRLTAQQVILLQSDLIHETGGEDGLREEWLLDASLNAPFASFDGLDVYPSVQQKAARRCFGLIKKHAFIDGNKRIGAHVMLVFLALNGIDLSYTQDELTQIILDVATGIATFEVLLNWLVDHQQYA